ncbi:hypothetical protein EMIHUDRAFT_242336 [Emiliania huxleyi CCMP1516]|uniref:Uncharacterized protein n=2 Tax=Emiliania huxleyi TaxID=2903 RepID=A0A0D3J9I7_EMIH1|nr:hypothetical protein EMIHUDRAFT_242336 [Emiliania huxleyi CCMP1516]EOD20172.1 hypothetical protein EMIHUDRAFT_242336 [Emiliania huxleyi CCMP1516]|eukprot:XP_005772601.1 hypothetical protein EMIHUDRAFT_242336 [Emiliania huxleyi CCMP1516]
MPSPDAAARHTGAGVARRQAHHERMRDERSGSGRGQRGASAGGRRGRRRRRTRRKRKREDVRAALNGHTVLPTRSRLEIFCDTERWYPATVMGREEDVDGRIAHQVEYDGYPDRRWWHMLDDERWRAVLRATSRERGGVGIAAGYLQKPRYIDEVYPGNTRTFAWLRLLGPHPQPLH